jgi:hypothetical protein
MASNDKNKSGILRNEHSFRRTRRYFLKMLPLKIIKVSALGQKQARIISLLS